MPSLKEEGQVLKRCRHHSKCPSQWFYDMLELKRKEPVQDFKRETSKPSFLRFGIKFSYAVSEGCFNR